MKRELLSFNPDKAPLTNLVGHQISKACAASIAVRQRFADPDLSFTEAYRSQLLREERYDFFRGNTAATVGMLFVAMLNNTTS